MNMMTAATNRQTHVWAQEVYRVSFGVKARVPAPLIDYLWDLAMAEEGSVGQTQWFVLQACALGGRKLQQIRHIARNNGAVEIHRVFGIEPVDCELQILSVQGGREMRLCGEDRTCVSRRETI